jgi:hypothetical protein
MMNLGVTVYRIICSGPQCATWEAPGVTRYRNGVVRTISHAHGYKTVEWDRTHVSL